MNCCAHSQVLFLLIVLLSAICDIKICFANSRNHYYYYYYDDDNNWQRSEDDYHDYDDEDEFEDHYNNYRYHDPSPSFQGKRERFRKNKIRPPSKAYEKHIMGYYNLQKPSVGHGIGGGYEDENLNQYTPDDPYFYTDHDLYHDSHFSNLPQDSQLPPLSPFGIDPSFKTQTGFEGALVPNKGYGLLPWGIEGVVIVIAAIIIFVIIIITILCLIFWASGIRKVIPQFMRSPEENEIEARSINFYNQWENSSSNMNTSFFNLVQRVFDALEKYDDLQQQNMET